MRRNKLIFAGEKKVASHSPAGVLLSSVDAACKRFVCWVWKCAPGRSFGATIAGPRNPHAVATEPRAIETSPSFMGERKGDVPGNGKQGHKYESFSTFAFGEYQETEMAAPVKLASLHANPAIARGSRGQRGGVPSFLVSLFASQHLCFSSCCRAWPAPAKGIWATWRGGLVFLAIYES